MQINALLTWAIKTLQPTTATPHLDAELLLAHVLEITRTQVIARRDAAIELLAEQNFKQLVMRRQAGEPIAYITGHREFWSLDLEVTPATLIPRPETELLVELALQKFPADAVVRVVDLGTGSGAIALAIAHERPRWLVVATDRSTTALTVAQRNAQRLGVHNVTFRQGDWCDALSADESFDLVISNPPYIAEHDVWLQKSNLHFEPRDALVASKDGMSELYLIVKQARRYLSQPGWLLLEHGYDQKKNLTEFLRSHDYIEIENHADFSGIMRVVAARVLT